MAKSTSIAAPAPRPSAGRIRSPQTLQDLHDRIGQVRRIPFAAANWRSTYPNVARLPVSIRIVLESVLRNCDGKKVTAEHVEQLANWKPTAARSEEIPFVVARVVLQDFTGVPLLVDLAAMRNVAADMGRDPKAIEPLVPVDLVVDHSVMVDHYGSRDALDLNMKLEFKRNEERYEFMKWGMQAFDTFRVVPPGFGIVHQVNLEYLARGVHRSKRRRARRAPLYYPDSLVGTDSHTTMINGIGVVGWGVGGIEAEAGMLGQPVYFLTPDVVGFELSGRLREGVTATDLVLTVTEILRQHKVVGKFVEFFGEGTASLAVPDRATIGNMAPEYGATMGFFPVDERTIDYFRGTGRSTAEIEAFEAYFRAQRMFGMPQAGEIDYSQVVTLDLGSVAPSLAGPKRPQDRIELGQRQGAVRVAVLEAADRERLQPAGRRAGAAGGHAVRAAVAQRRRADRRDHLVHQHLEPRRAAGGRPAREEGGRSRAEGAAAHQDLAGAGLAHRHRVPDKAGLLPYLEKLGFYLAGYGCTTCIGNAGDLTAEINDAITGNDLVCAAVLSGNRNFEARIHPNIKANFLASPPLVVAYAIAGTVLRDLMTEPVGNGTRRPRGLSRRHLADQRRDPRADEVRDERQRVQGQLRQGGQATRASCGSRSRASPARSTTGRNRPTSPSRRSSTASRCSRPPAPTAIRGARAMALFGDSITTDHISPAGSIKESSPAGRWLKEHGVLKADFNSYGSRRGNHDVMMRGTFANVRIKNLMIPPGADGSREEGGVTLFQPSGEKLFIYDAAMRYIADRHADGDLRRRGIRHRLVARLGRQGHRAARHQGGRRAQFRAHPSQQPGRHGRAAAAVQRRRQLGDRSASTATKPSTSCWPTRSGRSSRPRW